MNHAGPQFTARPGTTIDDILIELDRDGRQDIRLLDHSETDGREGRTWLYFDGWWVGVFIHQKTTLPPDARVGLRVDHFEFEKTSGEGTLDVIQRVFAKFDDTPLRPLYLASIPNGVDEVLFAFASAFERDSFMAMAMAKGLDVTTHDITALDNIDDATTFVEEL